MREEREVMGRAETRGSRGGSGQATEWWRMGRETSGWSVTIIGYDSMGMDYCQDTVLGA